MLLACFVQELDRKRHLLRLWVAPPVERPLPQCYAELYGTVKVGDLDREARHAVRINCQGFSPWSGSVSLQGKPAAKIRPALKPRAR